MIVYGIQVPERVLERADQFIAKNESFKSGSLSREIENEMRGLNGYETSNRILQKYRKANLLSHIGGGLWVRIPKMSDHE